MGEKCMEKSETTYIFHLCKPVKHFKQGEKNTPIEFREFPQHRKLCPVRTLDPCLSRTKQLRENAGTTKVFISFLLPHKAVSKDITARWVKLMLEQSGINIDILKHTQKEHEKSFIRRHIKK